jgi:SAM-dependent methyltransferase
MQSATRTRDAARPQTPYNDDFFDQQLAGSLRSARVIVPIVLELVRPRSVLDVGCGVGAWLKAFGEHGIEDYLGMDGGYVGPARLLIDPERFRPVDLTRPEPLGRSFDLAVCLEVGEHLPDSASLSLVRLLTEAAPVVLFSAALPGQGGTHHVNERWPAYWKERFAGRGFARLDPIRPRVWRDRRVEWWYQQNVCLFVQEALLHKSPRLLEEYELAQEFPLELVADGVLGSLLRVMTLRGLLAALPGVAMRAVRRLLTGRR